MKKAFTLIELLVVIAIIGILSAILVGTFSGGTASARSARCMTNMRNLAAACQTYLMKEGHYPLAASSEYRSINVSRGKKDLTFTYNEAKGWISWYSVGAYPSSKLPTSSKASDSWRLSTYESDADRRLFCLTNGALWKLISGNREVYRCPEHVRHMKENKKVKGLEPNWSYVMNAFFCGEVGTADLRRGGADKYLLFAEMPFNENVPTAGDEAKFETGAGTACDCTLHYKGYSDAKAEETIGVNHKVGRQYFAHVCFADGHCEKLLYPVKGNSSSDVSVDQLKNLTEWLCKGFDVGFRKGEYINLNGTSADAEK